jgi:transcriptional regulator with XRE-family HTH domain
MWESREVKRSARRIVTARMEAAMAAAGFTVHRHLALRLGVSPSQIKRWVEGTTTPEGATLERICAVLGVSAAYLLGTTDEQHADLLRAVGQALGSPTKKALEAMVKLSAEDRAMYAGRLLGMIERDTTTPAQDLTAMAPDVAAELVALKRELGVEPKTQRALKTAASSPASELPSRKH